MKKPDQVDFYDVDDFNFNADELDKKIAEILNAIIIASQNEAETGTDNVRMMSPLRVKQAILKLAPKPAIASQAEAETGTDNVRMMSPLRVKQAILKLAPKPAIASQAEAEAGTDNAKHMTPLRTKQAIEAFDNTPVGDVAFRPFLKAGYVKANGATVNRADYPRLVAFANANNLWTTNPANEPWKFGQGNGSTTMVLPNYVGRFIQGGDTPTIKEAGLPNITGEFSAECGSWPWHDHPNSAIYQNGLISNNGGFAGSDTDDLVKFDASRSNSIYGNSSTVQPPAITLLPQVRY